MVMSSQANIIVQEMLEIMSRKQWQIRQIN